MNKRCAKLLGRDKREVVWTCGIAFCFLAIALVTLHNLGAKSFWLDEAISAFYAEQSFFVIAKMSLLDHVPPMYYWLLRLYSKCFGDSDYALRLFSVFFNLGAAVFLWKLAREHFDWTTALYALLFFAGSNYLLAYAQTARSYPLFLFFTLGSIYYFFRALEEDRTRWWALYSLCLLCSLYTLYLAVATLAAIFALASWTGATRPLRWYLKYLFWTGLGLVGFLPWAVLLMRTHPSRHADWFAKTAPSGTLWGDFVGLFKAFFATETLSDVARGRGGYVLVTVFLLLIGSLCVYSLAVWWKNDRARRVLLFACVYVMLSVLVNLTLNIFASVDFPTARRFIFLAPFAYLFVAAGVAMIPPKTLQPLFLAILIVPNVVAMGRTYAHPSWEDWRGVTRYVEDNWQTDDLIVFSPGYINIAFDYYSKNEHRELGYPKGLMDPARMFWGYHYMRGPDEAERFLLQNSEAVRQSSRIWLIQSHNILYDLDKKIPDATMVMALENRASTKMEAFIKFNGVHVYLYSNAHDRNDGNANGSGRMK